MPRDTRNLAGVLRSELTFFDAGGYSAWAGARWRLPLVFEESPTCPNFNDTTHSVACKDCSLMQLVPLRHHYRAVPCRYIPLTEAGETLDTLYRWGTMDDLNLIFRRWLVQTIAHLESREVQRQWMRDQILYRAADLT